jgi:hypothetical protein
VVQDVKTKKCTIVDKKPATTTEVCVLGNGTVFKSRSEAETGMKSYQGLQQQPGGSAIR